MSIVIYEKSTYSLRGGLHEKKTFFSLFDLGCRTAMLRRYRERISSELARSRDLMTPE
jgi:hypothetical protein